MRLRHILNEGQFDDDEKIITWFEDHWNSSWLPPPHSSVHLAAAAKLDFKRKLCNINNGIFNYDGIVGLKCDEVKYQIGDVQALHFALDEPCLKSFKNFPKNARTYIYANDQLLSKFDYKVNCSELNLTDNKFTSLKDIHKFVSCEELIIYNSPVTNSILGVLLIPGIKTIIIGAESLQKDDKIHNMFHKALKIVVKYIGKGKAGILDAQEELIDNDLDDYAEA